MVAMLYRWPYCTGGLIAQVAILHRWPYFIVATLHRWPHCTGGHIAQVAMLHSWPYGTGWPYCTPVAVEVKDEYELCRRQDRAADDRDDEHDAPSHVPEESVVRPVCHGWPYCTGGPVVRRPCCTGSHIAPVATLHRWPQCTCGRIASAPPTMGTTDG